MMPHKMSTRPGSDTTHLIEQVKRTVALTEMVDYLKLRRRHRAIQCPNSQAHAHGDRTMSASIAPSGWSWRCHRCQIGGTVLDLVMVAQGLGMMDAALALADYAGIPLSPAERALLGRSSSAPPSLPTRQPPAPEPPPTPAPADVRAFLHTAQAQLTSTQAQAYLATRAIPLATAQRAGLGFAPRGAWPHSRGARQPRIVAPLTTPDGTLLTLYGRSTVLCEKPLRHDFLPGAKGVFNATALAQEGVVLVEGVFDALACLAGGLPAAALCGLATREGWWSAIRAETVVLALDADEAAQQRWEALASAATHAGKRVLVLKSQHLHPHKDLSEFWTRTRALPEALHRAVRETTPVDLGPPHCITRAIGG